MPRDRDQLPAHYQTALVTGASSGLGKAFAEALQKAGLTVYGTSRSPHDGAEDGIRWLVLDAATETGLETFMTEQEELFRNIDVLVNNAGFARFGSRLAADPGAMQSQLKVLLECPLRLTEAILPEMRKRHGGAIVNISSLAALFPLPFMRTYSAGKGGLSAYTRSLIITEQDPRMLLIDFQAGDFRTSFNANMQAEDHFPDAVETSVWERLEETLSHAPGPEMAARDLIRALQRGRSRTLRSGGFFQTWVAPLGMRLLPRSWMNHAMRRYFHIPRK